MTRQLLEDAQIIYSLAPETGVNVPYLLTAEFGSALINSYMPKVPQPTKVKDEQVGRGTEFGGKPRNMYWPPLDETIGGMLSTEFPAILATRCWGGSIANAVAAASVAWNHTVSLQTKAQGRTPKLTTWAWILGGYDFLHASCAIDSFEISFSGSDTPSWSAHLINTGYSWKRLRDITPAIDPPAVPTYHYMHPAGVNATFNNGGLVDFGADGRVVSGRCGMNNQVVVIPHGQDPFRIMSPAVNRKSGAYARDIHRRKRVYTPTLKVSMDEDLDEFIDSRDNTDITDLTYLFAGELIGASTTHSYEFEIKYPLSTLMVDSDPDNDDAGISMSFDIDRDDAPGGIAILRIKNGTSTIV
jgi:hypothetical protein